MKELRKEYDNTQEALAKKIGVERHMISKWELNETSPDLKQTKKLADTFGITLYELCDKKNTKEEKSK